MRGAHAEAGVIAFRRHDPRTDGVDTDLTGLEIGRPAAGEGPDGGLAGAVDTEGFRAIGSRRRGRQDDRAAVLHQRQGFLHCEKRPFDVAVESFVKVLFRNSAERRKAPSPRIGDEDINVPFLLFHLFIQAIKIGQVGDVTLNAGDVAPYFLDGLIQFFLAAASNENICAFRDKSFCRCKADAAGAAGNDGCFPFEFVGHGIFPRFWI
ncbi:hypothetical protein SBA4_1480009 [Candidatus Sulfopaludibacter sp. SbA4]|nr:hypothetical protein SBA4_1480009 [Candidatus Sulfopaludibacter sp. SbA4]